MVRLAQNQTLFEHLFPLPAMFKVNPSVRACVDHAARHEDVNTCDRVELYIYLTPVANQHNIPATEIASEWNKTHKDAGMRFLSTSPHIVILKRDVCVPTQLKQVVELLSRDSRVADIQLRPRFRVPTG